MSQSRQALRQTLREKRRSLSDAMRRRADANLLRRLISSPFFQHSRHIALYLANDGECDISGLIKIAWARNKVCYLPCLTTDKKLLFAPISPAIEMAENHYGILEPQVKKQDYITPKQLDLVLMPLVGFDRQGNRLGMGGGYYDRSFAFLKHRRHWQRPRLIGIGYDFQQVDKLDNREWDVPLHAVISNKALLRCRKK